VLAPGGLVAFTVETHDSEGVVIGEGLRYVHAAEYLRTTIAAVGLKLAHLEQASPRIEDNEPVRGLVVVATKT
jgi:predicted TPR repeat methyltransferase